MNLLTIALLISPTLSGPIKVEPVVKTEPVSHDADDPAIWINRHNPENSLIIGTNKIAAPDGGLYVFRLDGSVKQRIKNLDRPNNVDLQSGFIAGNQKIDIVVTTERLKNQLRIYKMLPTGTLAEISGAAKVFEGRSGEHAAPMGITLYQDQKSKKVYAFVSSKEGDRTDYIWQYQLIYNPRSQCVDAKFVRSFGAFSGKQEIEAMFVDDQNGILYYSDETFGVRKYQINSLTTKPHALGVLAKSGWAGDHEGIAIYATSKHDGYLVLTDQIKDGTIQRVYRRTAAGAQSLLYELATGADDTDGIEITSEPLGNRFPKGIMVVMNSKGKNFWIFDCRDLFGIAKN